MFAHYREPGSARNFLELSNAIHLELWREALQVEQDCYGKDKAHGSVPAAGGLAYIVPKRVSSGGIVNGDG